MNGQWQIRSREMGRLFVAAGDEAATSVVTGGTYVKVSGTTTAGYLNGFQHSNGRLIYIGSKRWFHILSVITATVDLAGGTTHFRIAKNGSAISDSEQHRKITSAGDRGNMSCETIVELSTGDYIELFCTTNSGEDNKNITAEHYSIVAR